MRTPALGLSCLLVLTACGSKGGGANPEPSGDATADDDESSEADALGTNEPAPNQPSASNPETMPNPMATGEQETPTGNDEDGTMEMTAEPEMAPEAMIGEPEVMMEPPASEVTWHQQIAPLVREKCAGCHTEAGIAPFSLDSYEQASTLSLLMLDAIQRGIMPPWGAQETDECTPRFGFKDDLRLSEEQIALFDNWVTLGTPEGDPSVATPLPERPNLALPNPDLSLTLPDVSVQGPSDRFLCFSLDPGIAADAWINASQIVPGNDAIVHHVLTYVDEAGASAALADENGSYECFGGPGVDGAVLLSAWAPGGVPWRTPNDVAMSLPAGSRLIVNVHYHPTGSAEEVDSGTRVDFGFAQTEPAYEGQVVLIGNFQSASALGELLPGESDPPSGVAFTIPAGASGHIERMRFVVPSIVPEGILWAVGTHMHYVGTDMLMTIERSSATDTQPSEECLLQTPAWDFNWQRGYVYDAPLSTLPTAGPGDTLSLRCTYDNSLDNPFVRRALDEQGLTEPRDVVLGEDSLDEMCLGAFGIAYPR